MANALIRNSLRRRYSEPSNAEALNDRYLEFGLRPPEHVEEEVLEKEDLEPEPVRMWVAEGKKPPSLKVRWFIHEEAPRDEPGWFERNITIPTSLSWVVHFSAVFFTALWPSTRLEISVTDQGVPVEIVFAPDIAGFSLPGGAGGQDFAIDSDLADPVQAAQIDPENLAVNETPPEEIAPDPESETVFDEPAPEPPSIEDLLAGEFGEAEEVDAMSAIASSPQPDLPDVEPIPEPEPPQPVGTGPEAPDPVEVAEPDFAATDQTDILDDFAPSDLLDDGLAAIDDTDVSAPELVEPDALLPVPGSQEVDVTVDGNDLPAEPIDEAPPPNLAEAPLPAEPVTDAPDAPAEFETFVPEADVAELTFPEFSEDFEPLLVPEPEPEPLPEPEPIAEPEPLPEPEPAPEPLPEPDPLPEPVDVAEVPEDDVQAPIEPEVQDTPAPSPPETDPFDLIEPDRDAAEDALADLLEEAEEFIEEEPLPEVTPGIEEAEEEPPAEVPPNAVEQVAQAPEAEGPAAPIPLARPFTIEDPEPEPEPEPQPEPQPQPTQVAEANEGAEGQGAGPGTGAAETGAGTGSGSGLGGGQVAAAPSLPGSLQPGAQLRVQPPQQQRAQSFTPASFNDPSLGNETPEYPERLRIRGIEGTVLIRVVVGPSGDPLSVEVARSSGSRELDAETRRAVQRWRYIPAKRNGEPVIDELLLPFRFRLQ